MNTFGKNFRVTTFGESHGKAIGAVIDGCPAGLDLSNEDIQKELDKRKPGQSKITTQRKESDKVEILSGVFEGKTLGTPIAAMIINSDAKSKDYESLKNVFRPGHADEVWQKKFGIRDHRGGGRSSGRETIGRVIGGAIAKKLLSKISKTKIIAHTKSIGNIFAESFEEKEIEKNIVKCADKKAAEKMIREIEEVKKEKNSLGGLVQIDIKNPPKYIGEPVFGKIEAKLAEALLSIGAVRGFEIGSGFSAAGLKGSQQNELREGISGGITTGEDVSIMISVKPTPSISLPQVAKTLNDGEIDLEISGRHDPVILPRLIPVAEAMVALVLIDALMFQHCNIDSFY